MRFFIILLLFISNLALANDISKVSILNTQPYDPRNENGRDISKFTNGLGIFFFGGLFKPDAEDLKKEILKELNRPELNDYFNSSQKNALAERVSQTVSKSILSKGLDNAVTVEAIKYSVNELIGEIISRIMNKEGIKSGARIDLWKLRILSVFNTCIDKAKIQSEAEKCQESFQVDLVKNIGVAIANELALQELGEDYSDSSAKKYYSCISNFKIDGNSHVKNCVLTSMQEQIYNYGRKSLREVAQKQTPTKATEVVNEVSGGFKKCLNSTKTRDDFMKCGDQFTANGGGAIIYSAIMTNTDLNENISSLSDMTRLASSAKKDFIECVNNNITNNQREKSGNVATNNCEKKVRNKVTQIAIKYLFSNNIKKTISSSEKARSSIEKSSLEHFNSCWDNDSSNSKNNKCLRGSIINLVNKIAESRLSTDMPKTVQSANFKNSLMQTLNECLLETLPNEIIEDPQAATKKIDSCSQKITKTASLRVAEYEIKSALKERIKDDEKANALTAKTVKDFSECLGGAPDNLKIDLCSIKLRKAVGKIIATELFPEEFDSFINEHGGLSAYSMTPQDRENFLRTLLSQHTQCLNDNLTILTIQKSTENLNDCFRSSIKMFALFLAEKEFQRSTQNKVNISKNILTKITKDFISDFDSCLSPKNEKQMPISTLLQQIDKCKIELTKKYTLSVAKAALRESLNQHIVGDEKTKNQLEESLIKNYESCLTSSNQRELNKNCLEDFKREATGNIALIEGQSQVKLILRSKESPKEIKIIEEELKACIKNKKTNDCAKPYVSNLAKKIGSIKLRHSLSDAVGKPKYIESETAILNFEKTYYDCIDQIKIDEINNDFLEAISACGDQLQNQTINFLQDKTKQWMADRQENNSASKIIDFAGNALPCLEKVGHDTAFDENALNNIDPEGTLEIISNMIGDYINYDINAAGENVDFIFKQIFRDLEKAGPEQARANLLNSLVQRGVLDQFLKALIQKEVRDTFKNLPPADQISPQIQDKLLSKDNLDQIMNKNLLDKYRTILAEKILGPALIRGESMSGPEPQAALALIRKDIGNTLLSSDKFGGEILSYSVQKQLDSLGWIDRSYVSYYYGSESLDWSVVRTRAKGKVAENYIRDFIIKPKFTGESVSAETAARRVEIASKLIEDALSQTTP